MMAKCLIADDETSYVFFPQVVPLSQDPNKAHTWHLVAVSLSLFSPITITQPFFFAIYLLKKPGRLSGRVYQPPDWVGCFPGVD